MKLKFEFPFETIAWPALLVDTSCLVRRANPPARATFEALATAEDLPLIKIWSNENEDTPEHFLHKLERATGGVVNVKLFCQGGTVQDFKTLGAILHLEEHRYFLLQLLPAAQTPSTVHDAHTVGCVPVRGAFDANVMQRQKLECAMQLIRTVSLDFNNVLTSILGHTSLLLARSGPDHPWRKSLLEVEKSAEKAAEVAQDLASFSRQEKELKTSAAGNLNDLLRRTMDCFRAQEDPRIVWTTQLEGKLYTVTFDEAKMQQAFMKVIENAVQALGKEKKITIRTRNLHLETPWKEGAVQMPPGCYVCTEIFDNGCGIPPDVLPRIFEPFFTTKAEHRGLGLAWVYGIITNHGGCVTVASEPGQNTTVRIYLPALKKIVKDQSFESSDLEGNQTILMVDDEDLLLTMGQTVLSAFGYRVLTANSGAKALELFHKEKSNVDLVITDLVMPLMSGRELIEKLRSLQPDLLILCTSGFVRPVPVDEEENYLKKPFTSQELLAKVKQILT